jgi:hypothetical protein
MVLKFPPFTKEGWPARHRYLPDIASHWQAGAKALAGGGGFLSIFTFYPFQKFFARRNI